MPARILYVEINEDGTVGGSYQCLYDLVRHLDRSCYEPVVVFYEQNPWVERLRALGVEVHAWDAIRRHERGAGAGPLRPLRLASRLLGGVWRRWRFLRRERIALLHLNNSPSVTFQDWLPAARLAGIPCITHARGNVFVPRRRWQRLLITRYDRVLPISRAIAADVRATGIAESRITLVHDGVDLEAFRARLSRPPEAVRAELGVAPGTLLVAMVGHLRWWKGQREVLEALALLTPAERDRLLVVFVGDVAPAERDYREGLERRIGELGLERCARLLGRRDDVPDLMRAADVVLHASTVPEPFGLVVVEALALGRPVIASRFGGPADIVTPETGVAVDPTAPVELAAALRALAGDRAARVRIGAAGAERADAFTVRRTMDAVHRVYGELLRAGAPHAHMPAAQPSAA